MTRSSDPASTVDAPAGAVTEVRQAELGLVMLGGVSGALPLELAWGNARELTLGRDEDCAIHLANSDVSRRHAVLRRTDDAGLTVTDLGSRNGTRVNGEAVQSARLQANDVLRVGGCVFVVAESAGAFIEVAPGLFGGAGLRRALAPLQRAAESDLPIVLQGETGTGKEVVARAVHGWSGRTGPLLALNCAALPLHLAEAELFGYRRGAFTGADRASPGFFRNAEGGTLLLDEVSELPLALQAKLLRALEQKEVQPLGEARPVPVDVRIVVAGQESLLEAVKEQRFRADLLARLSGFSLVLPPLRERREDVLPLFLHFARELRQGSLPELELEPELVERLALHDFPFNVRELLLLARRLAVFQGAESVLRAQHLPAGFGDIAAASGAPVPAVPASVDPARPSAGPGRAKAVDVAMMIDALQAASGNVTRAAAELGITRQRAYRLLEGQDLAELAGKPRPKRP